MARMLSEAQWPWWWLWWWLWPRRSPAMPVALPEILGSFGGCDCGGNGGSSGSAWNFWARTERGDRHSENIALKALATAADDFGDGRQCVGDRPSEILRQRGSFATVKSCHLREKGRISVLLFTTEFLLHFSTDFCSSFYNRISVAFLQQG